MLTEQRLRLIPGQDILNTRPVPSRVDIHLVDTYFILWELALGKISLHDSDILSIHGVDAFFDNPLNSHCGVFVPS
jgi:hypothetical protein